MSTFSGYHLEINQTSKGKIYSAQHHMMYLQAIKGNNRPKYIPPKMDPDSGFYQPGFHYIGLWLKPRFSFLYFVDEQFNCFDSDLPCRLLDRYYPGIQ